jgi:hypothetical protein
MPTTATADELVCYYDDGANPPDTPLRVEAERAYRAAFLDAAGEVVRLEDCFEYLPLDRAWDERRQARDAAEVEPDMFRPEHIIAAARARGRVQAFEFVAQARERGQDRGYSDQRLAAEVIAPWGQRVTAWAAKELDPARVTLPPRPDDDWPDDPEPKPLARRAAPRVRRDSQSTRPGNLAFLWNGTQPDSAPAEKPEPERLRLPTLTLAQLVDHFPRLREPVIHGLLRQGETMNVISSSKTGKSWLVSDLALAVALGRPWLDAFPCEPGRVLIIDNELHRETSAFRIPKVMEARGIGLNEVGDRIVVSNLRGRLKDIVGLGTYFAEMEPDEYKVIILDAFYRFLPKDADENSNANMALLYNYLDSYADKLGCSFVLVHHSTKGNQSAKSITDVGAGAGSQSRATDTHLVLRAHEQDDVVVVDAAVRSWPPILPRCLRWTFPVWTIDDALDPTDLRPERPRRKPKPVPVEAANDEPAWDAERFASSFVTAEPATKLAIEQAALKVIPSERRVAKLMKLAEHQGLIHRWKFAANQPSLYATVPQPKINVEEVSG